jgi:hypothetical protein
LKLLVGFRDMIVHKHRSFSLFGPAGVLNSGTRSLSPHFPKVQSI